MNPDPTRYLGPIWTIQLEVDAAVSASAVTAESAAALGLEALVCCLVLGALGIHSDLWSVILQKAHGQDYYPTLSRFVIPGLCY